MKSFENNLKDRFNNASSLEGIDSDEIWNNIEPIIADEPKKKRPFFFWMRYALLFLFLSFIIGGIAWYQAKGDAVSSIESPSAESLIPKTSNQKVNTEVANTTTEISSTPINDNDPIVTNKDLNDPLPQNSSLENKNITSKTIRKNSNKNKNLASKANEKALSLDKKKNDSNSKTKTSPIETDKLNSISNKLDKTNPIKEGDPVVEIDPDLKKKIATVEKPSAIQKIESLPLSLLDNEPKVDLSKKITLLDLNRKDSKLSFLIFAGGHTIKNNFTAPFEADKERSDLLNNNYHLELGYSFGLEAGYRFYKNISLTTGLEYLQSKSEFNLIQTWDTIMVNPSSPFGALTDAIATRTVKHHNKTRYLSIPILVGVQKSLGKIDFGANAGIGLNFTRTQSGKALNFINQIAIYPDTEQKLLPIPKFFISYHLRPYLNYKLNKNWWFQFRTDIRYQNFKKSDFYNLDYSALFLGTSIGIGYKF